jgi:hypothetical protein
VCVERLGEKCVERLGENNGGEWWMSGGCSRMIKNHNNMDLPHFSSL